MIVWLVAFGYLWPAPVEFWDVRIDPPDPKFQQRVINQAAERATPGYGPGLRRLWIRDA